MLFFIKECGIGHGSPDTATHAEIPPLRLEKQQQFDEE
jgi:hypothetical protein